MDKQNLIFWETIDIFHKAGILDNIIIIGSWAEYLYELGYFTDFKSNLKTMDIDFLIKNIRMPRNKIDIVGILEDNDYLASVDRNGVTRFFKGAQIEIEFLARELGKGQIEPYRVEPLGIKVEGLRSVNLLYDNAIKLNVHGYTLLVPKPQAYVLHKIVINDKRGKKQEKDILSIKKLIEVFNLYSTEIDSFRKLYLELSRKDKQKVDIFLKNNFIDMFYL